MRDEEMVRACWKRVRYSEEGLTSDGPCYVVISLDDHPTAGTTLFMKHGASKEAVFAAARAFTVSRLEEVRQLRDANKWLAMARSAWLDHMSAGTEETSQQPKVTVALLLNRELATVSAGLRPEIVADLPKWIKEGEEAK